MMEKHVRTVETPRTHLLGRIAWLYYHENLTQAEIAERLGISRVTINRMLKEARESGIVEIKVHTGSPELFTQAERLSRQFGLRDAVIAEPGDEEDDRTSLARAAAETLSQRLQDGLRVGLGIGRTIAQLPEFFRPGTTIACQFIGLTGGLNLEESVAHSFDVVSRLAGACGATPLFIPAPSYVTDAALQQRLLQEQAVIHALELAQRSDIAVFSVGAADYSALLFEYGLISKEEQQQFYHQQVVGDLLGRFFDANGQELSLPLNDRILGLHLDQLKSIPLKILVAGGENKLNALRAALRCGYCNILVTDLVTATRLLDGS
jgi:DNA-binding transcriptional regulator LsrR (DeoR family)